MKSSKPKEFKVLGTLKKRSTQSEDFSSSRSYMFESTYIPFVYDDIKQEDVADLDSFTEFPKGSRLAIRCKDACPPVTYK